MANDSSTPNNQTVAPAPTSIGTGQPAAPISDFSVKTLTQEVNRHIQFSGYLKAVGELVGGLNYTPLTGGVKEYGTVIPHNTYNFTDNAYIPTDENYDTAGTGLVANNRNDAFEHRVVEQWKFTMPTTEVNSNYNYSTLDYRFGKYAQKLLGEEFINLVMSDIKHIIDLKRANDILFGVDLYMNKGDTSKTHYDGLVDMINNAKADAPTLTGLTAPLASTYTDFDAIDIVGYSNKYLYLGSYTYTPSGGSATTVDGATDLECFAQLMTALNVIGSNVHTAFSYGTTKSTATTTYKYSSENDNLERICVLPSFLSRVKAKNLQFYKQLTELYDQGKLFVLPKSFPQVKFVKGDFVCKWYAIQNTSSTTAGYINLANDEMMIYSANGFIKHTQQFGNEFSDGYILGAGGHEQITPNNITKHISIVELHGNAINPSAPCLIIKAPALINLSEGQLP